MRTPIHIDYANTRGTSRQSASTREQFSTINSPFPHNHHKSNPTNPTEMDHSSSPLKDSIPWPSNLTSPTDMKTLPFHDQELDSDSNDFKSSHSADSPGILSFPPQDNDTSSIGAYPESVSSSPRYLHSNGNMVMISPSAPPISLSPSVFPVPISHITQPTSNGAGSTILFPPCLYTPITVSQNIPNLPSLPIPTYPSVFMVPQPSSQGIVLPVMMADRMVPIPTTPPSQRLETDGIRMVSDVSGFHQEGEINRIHSCPGPMGANVFVYHIPSNIDDERLCELFSPFGTILSTKVSFLVMIHVPGLCRSSDETKSRVWVC